MIRQEEKVPREVGLGKATILTNEVPIAKVEKMKQIAHRPLKGQKKG